MKHRRHLFSAKTPYIISDNLFLEAVRENCLFHYKNCPDYRKILNALNFGENEIMSDMPLDEYLAKLPFLPTLLLKRRRMYSLPPRRIALKATSSGTSGRFSEIGFDLGSLICGLKMVIKIGKYHKLFSPIPCRYIVMGYRPRKGSSAAVAKTAFGATLFTPCVSRRYILNFKDGRYVPDFEGIIKAVQGCEKKVPARSFYGISRLYLFFIAGNGAAGNFGKAP